MISQIDPIKDQTLFIGSSMAMQDTAINLARQFRGGEILCLYGELGSGKTTFTQGLASGLGIQEAVNSPTFNILKLYPIKDAQQDIKRLYHIDCYRLEKPEDILGLGFKEWISDKEGITVIEWADKIKSILPKNRIDINFKITGENTRKLIIAS
ncbi:MAG: tRNA (adenosine(37)-N6)-threonylcarbamoyltransferase complex ATPase subunit type 1 TsaE [Patescibacteria group bacterium]|nr:tRNA (adenosine(37)-N6)-threonylcarbamoyltransferase complex ATPase subunit type 1 TsaE [Patescibacteria group bacterium]